MFLFSNRLTRIKAGGAGSWAPYNTERHILPEPLWENLVTKMSQEISSPKCHMIVRRLSGISVLVNCPSVDYLVTLTTFFQNEKKRKKGIGRGGREEREEEEEIINEESNLVSLPQKQLTLETQWAKLNINHCFWLAFGSTGERYPPGFQKPARWVQHLTSPLRSSDLE